jgi:tRNA G37 N-methylase TrmD
MTVHPLEQTYVEAKDAFNRHRAANNQPPVEALDTLERVIFAVSIRNGVLDFSVNPNTKQWTANAHFRVDDTPVHCKGHGDTMLAAAADMHAQVSDAVRWQGTGT